MQPVVAKAQTMELMQQVLKRMSELDERNSMVYQDLLTILSRDEDDLARFRKLYDVTLKRGVADIDYRTSRSRSARKTAFYIGTAINSLGVRANVPECAVEQDSLGRPKIPTSLVINTNVVDAFHRGQFRIEQKDWIALMAPKGVS